jgi:hypothetical protein
MTMIEFARLAAKTNVFTARVTLKALANSSPGFALKPWETQSLKGLRTSQSQPFQSCEEFLLTTMTQGCEAQPWAGIRERFQR